MVAALMVTPIFLTEEMSTFSPVCFLLSLLILYLWQNNSILNFFLPL